MSHDSTPGVTIPPPAPTKAEVERVARCATAAARLLGWNPLPDGAHRGQVLRTAIELGGMAEECSSLADEHNVWTFRLGASAEIDWDWEPKDDERATVIRYSFGCRDCERVETQVELVRRWHCFSWVHHADFGSGCYRTRAACEQARSGFRESIPCALRTGSAWCQRDARTKCYESVWACMRQAGRGACVRDP